MFCGKCGTENPDDNKYCLKCGADLEKMRTPPPRGRKSVGEKPTAGGKVSTTDFRQSIGEMKTALSDEDIALLFDKGALIHERYEIKALLGKGGMGVVYQVYDRLLGEEAALKMMLPSLMMQKRAVERFIQEARISMHLSHENIVRVRDIGEFQSLRYISMEYVKGVTLRQLLEEKRGKGEAFSLEECWKIVIQIVKGLLYAHKRTVHRDIKPENIMLTPEGVVKIMDFGIAKAMDLSKFISTSSSLGTAYYMAPEQTKASAKVDQRADIFSVGVILYEMLTGAIPMGSFESPHSINPQIAEEIDAIIERALKPLPEDRYQSIAELKEELAEIEKDYLISEEREPLKLKKLTKPPIIDTNFIRCIDCHTNNPLERRFCYHCGANLRITCPKCGKEIRVDLTYCGKCGANVQEAKKRKIEELEAKAKGYIEAKEYENAEKEIDAIAELDRKRPVIAQLREGIEKRKEQVRKAEELVQKASALLKDKKYQEAVDAAKSALELDRANQQAQHIQEEALSKIRKIEALYKETDDKLNSHRYANALKLYEQLKELKPKDKTVASRINEIKLKIAGEKAKAQRRLLIAAVVTIVTAAGMIAVSLSIRSYKRYTQEKDFNITKRIDSLSKWKEFLAKYQRGTYADYAWARIIDLSPWIMFRHDLQHTGRSPYKGPKKPNLMWTFATGGPIDSSPAIGADGTIYVGSWDKKLYAINCDGSKKWEFVTGGKVYSSPSIGADGTIYVGSIDNKLYAVNSDGSKKWEFLAGGSDTIPTIVADGTIYVGSFDNKLYAINPDGSKKWEFVTGHWVDSSPAIGDNGTIYVGSYDRKLYAINPNGSKKWEFATGSIIESSPAIGADGTIYVGSWDGKLYATNPDGSKKWEFATKGSIRSSPAIGKDGTIYVGSNDQNLYAITPEGSKKWTFYSTAIESSPAIGADGTIYVGTAKLYSFNPSGSKKWEYATGGFISSSPAIGADGTIYVGSRDGKLYAIGEKNK